MKQQRSVAALTEEQDGDVGRSFQKSVGCYERMAEKSVGQLKECTRKLIGTKIQISVVCKIKKTLFSFIFFNSLQNKNNPFMGLCQQIKECTTFFFFVYETRERGRKGERVKLYYLITDNNVMGDVLDELN